MSDTKFQFNQCSVCGVRYTKNEQGDMTFYWSNSGVSATPNQVASKICRYAKQRGQTECVNQKGEAVDGLGWGESFTERVMEAMWEQNKG